MIDCPFCRAPLVGHICKTDDGEGVGEYVAFVSWECSDCNLQVTVVPKKDGLQFPTGLMENVVFHKRDKIIG